MMVLCVIMLFQEEAYLWLSKINDILFIESSHISIVSIYGTGTTVAYFDNNKEWILTTIGIIRSCDFILYFILVLQR